MAYAPPPGSNSLPARPPPSSHDATHSPSGFKPAFGSAPRTYSSAPRHQPASTPFADAASAHYAAPASSRPSYGAAPSGQHPSAASYASLAYSSYPGAAPGVSSSAPGYSQQQQPPLGYGAPSNAYANASYAPPQIQNPFPLPGTGPSGYDPHEAAQIAEWQSAYNGVPQAAKDAKAVGAAASESSKADAAADAAANDKKKTVMRQGGGKKWTDDSLLEWDPAHLRLFVGNLAGETTDESLLKAFSRWRSVQKARVIRDKRTTKSKGYGFVSFSDADDFFQAAKEMNGKYIQSHPVVIRKANTEIKVTNAKERGKGGKHNAKNNKANKAGHSGGQHHGGPSYEPSLGPVAATGVTKPGQKTKNGLRLLG